MSARLLLFGYGNPSRGDDALGPAFLEAVQARTPPDAAAVFDCLTDFQLQVEHALDLQAYERVLFVDASVSVPAPFRVESLQARRDDSYTTHAMTPSAVLQVYREICAAEPPQTWLLTIRGEHFELGDPLSPAAGDNLAAALAHFEQVLLPSWLGNP